MDIVVTTAILYLMRSFKALQLPVDYAEQLLGKEIKVKLNMEPKQHHIG